MRILGPKQITFDNYSEFIDYASKVDTNFCKQFDGNWFADKGYEHSLELARNGWKDGRKLVKAYLDKLDISGKVTKPEIYFTEVGDGGFDIGRVLSGEPECMMDWRETESTKNEPHIIKIVVDVAASQSIGARMLQARGAAILALIDALEEAGKRIEIDAIFYDPYRKVELTIPIKSADYQPQIDQIAYALAHPAFMRRFCHIVVGSGISPTEKENHGADIYFKPMYLLDHDWTSEESTLEWIKEILRKYGVALGK